MNPFDRVLDVIAILIGAFAIMPVALFIYYYGSQAIPGKKWKRRYSNAWKATSIGRTLMYQKIAWFFFLLFAILNLFFQAYAGKSEIRIVIYTALFILFWRMFYNLRILQIHGADRIEAVRGEPTRKERRAYNQPSTIVESVEINPDQPKH